VLQYKLPVTHNLAVRELNDSVDDEFWHMKDINDFFIKNINGISFI
jgi:hypothetical protein